MRSLDSANEAIAYSLQPLPRQLGGKYGKRFPEIRKALQALEPTPAARALLAGESVRVQLASEAVDIMPDEVEVRLTAKEGFAVAEEGGLIAALVTELTPELVREGQAREVVRRVQDMRKFRGLNVSDRVHIKYCASVELASAIEENREHIMGETLALSLHASEEIDGEEYELGSERLVLDVSKA